MLLYAKLKKSLPSVNLLSPDSLPASKKKKRLGAITAQVFGKRQSYSPERGKWGTMSYLWSCLMKLRQNFCGAKKMFLVPGMILTAAMGNLTLLYFFMLLGQAGVVPVSWGKQEVTGSKQRHWFSDHRDVRRHPVPGPQGQRRRRRLPRVWPHLQSGTPWRRLQLHPSPHGPSQGRVLSGPVPARASLQ